jgi:hypothetical protein
VVAEPVTAAKVNYTVGQAVAEKDYDFKGKKADAWKYEMKCDDRVSIFIYAPKAPTKDYHNHSVAETAEAAAYLPKGAREKITAVLLNPVTNPEDPYWATQYKTPNFHSYMTAGEAGVRTPRKTSGSTGRRGWMTTRWQSRTMPETASRRMSPKRSRCT